VTWFRAIAAVTQQAFHSQAAMQRAPTSRKEAEYAPKWQIQLVACQTTLSFDRVCPGTEQTVLRSC